MLRLYLILGLGAALIAGGAFVFSQPGDEPMTAEELNQEEDSDEAGMEDESGENVVFYTDSGFSPQELTIRAGETVTFRNEGSRQTWPASDIHPTHTLYPGSGIQQCGSPEASSIFDSCKRIASGEEWSFTFGEKGSWRYHDHTLPGHRGTIIVE